MPRANDKPMTDVELVAAAELLRSKSLHVEAHNRQRERCGEAMAYTEVWPELEDVIECELRRRGIL